MSSKAAFMANTRSPKNMLWPLLGGLNDTAIPEIRNVGEYKTLENVDFGWPPHIKKSKGRSYYNSNLSGEITGLMVPPADIFLVELDSTNNAVYFKVGAGYYTASIAAGKYYLYSALATALQTAMNAAYGSSLFTVAFSYTTYKFTISTSATAFTVCWYHDSTTVDTRKFGFLYSVESSENTITSEYAVSCEPPLRQLMTLTKTYHFDGTSQSEMTFPDGTSFGSDEKIYGIWHNKNFYGSTPQESFVIRDRKFVRKLPDPSIVDFMTVTKNVLNVDLPAFYNNDPDYPDSQVRLTFPGVAIPLTSHQDDDHLEAVRLINSIRIWLQRSSDDSDDPADWTAGIYYECPAIGRSELIKAISPYDVGSEGGYYDVPIETELGPISYEAYRDIGSRIAIRYINPPADYDKASLWFGIHETLTGPPYYALDEDGVWTQKESNEDTICAEVLCQKSSNFSNGAVSYKVSFENEEGFETKLSEAKGTISESWNSPHDVLMKFATPLTNYDIKHINFYRTVSGGDIYYKMGRVPYRSQYDNEIYLEDGWWDDIADDDSWAEEADVTTERAGPQPFRHSIYWDDRHWATDIETGVSVFSEADEPENFDYSEGNVTTARDGAPCTGRIGFDTLQLIFKQNSLWSISKSGDTYAAGTEPVSDSIGTLSHYSINLVHTENGSGVLWQGQNGHFYYTDGTNVACISEGRLETLVASMNKEYLTETVSYYDVTNQDMIWMVCTGSNTAPDTQVIFNIRTQSWRTKTMAAAILAPDRINSSYPNQELLMGSNAAGKTFYFNLADTDLGNAISSTVETADEYYSGDDSIYNAFMASYFTMKGATAAQSLIYKWYLDCSNTEDHADGVTITPGTASTRIRQAISGTGKRIRHKLTNSDSLGQWEISAREHEFNVQGTRW